MLTEGELTVCEPPLPLVTPQTMPVRDHPAGVAPLWSIDDAIARQIAVRFYERALRGEAPAEILRTERAAFRDAPETISSTYLAYQFFGHPGLRLQ